MTQQFSKLNKIGNSFKSKPRQKPNFTIGQKSKNETSSDSEEDYENSIFQPDISVETEAQRYVSDLIDIGIEQGLEMTEETMISSPKVDTFLPGVGIVMGNTTEEPVEGVLENRHNLLSRVDSSQLNEVQLSSIMQNVTINTEGSNPEIRVNSSLVDSNAPRKTPPNTLQLGKRNLSRSSGDVDDNKETDDSSHAADSSYDSISQSQSESALKSIVSPISNATKEMVLSPFTKFAKGVQNISANLDPRKLSGQVRFVSEREMEEHRKLQERWQDSKTRLIAL